jgi:hypothetical protein
MMHRFEPEDVGVKEASDDESLYEDERSDEEEREKEEPEENAIDEETGPIEEGEVEDPFPDGIEHLEEEDWDDDPLPFLR